MNVMFMDIMSEVVKRAYLMFKNREFSVDFTPVHTKQLTLFLSRLYIFLDLMQIACIIFTNHFSLISKTVNMEKLK